MFRDILLLRQNSDLVCIGNPGGPEMAAGATVPLLVLLPVLVAAVGQAVAGLTVHHLLLFGPAST